MGGRSHAPPSPTRGVTFASQVSSSRPAREDEVYVITAFASHASHCPKCADPYETYLSGKTLCSRGHIYARELCDYIYNKAGLPFSVIDEARTGERVQIELPAGKEGESVRRLLKAINRGLRIRTKEEERAARRAETLVINQQQKAPRELNHRYLVPESTAARGQRVDPNYVEIRPASKREDRKERERDSGRTVRYLQGRGSLHQEREAERRQREKENLEPVILIAEPGRRYNG